LLMHGRPVKVQNCSFATALFKVTPSRSTTAPSGSRAEVFIDATQDTSSCGQLIDSLGVGGGKQRVDGDVPVSRRSRRRSTCRGRGLRGVPQDLGAIIVEGERPTAGTQEPGPGATYHRVGRHRDGRCALLLADNPFIL
jgi:hypothetical protein